MISPFHDSVVIRLLYEIGPLKFWLYSAESGTVMHGMPVMDENGRRIGQLVCEYKK